MKYKPYEIYLILIGLSVPIFIALLILVLNYLNFEPKAKWSLYMVGSISMTIKAILFSIPLILLTEKFKTKRKTLFLYSLPFLLYLIWFMFIIVFKIEGLWFDLSYGYFSRFPHFYLQLIAISVPSVIMLRYRLKILKTNANTP